MFSLEVRISLMFFLLSHQLLNLLGFVQLSCFKTEEADHHETTIFSPITAT